MSASASADGDAVLPDSAAAERGVEVRWTPLTPAMRTLLQEQAAPRPIVISVGMTTAAAGGVWMLGGWPPPATPSGWLVAGYVLVVLAALVTFVGIWLKIRALHALRQGHFVRYTGWIVLEREEDSEGDDYRLKTEATHAGPRTFALSSNTFDALREQLGAELCHGRHWRFPNQWLTEYAARVTVVAVPGTGDLLEVQDRQGRLAFRDRAYARCLAGPDERNVSAPA